MHSNTTRNDDDLKWKRVFQCCQCNSTCIKEILVRCHNQNLSDWNIENPPSINEELPVDSRTLLNNERNSDMPTSLDFQTKGGVKRK